LRSAANVAEAVVAATITVATDKRNLLTMESLLLVRWTGICGCRPGSTPALTKDLDFLEIVFQLA